MQKILQALLTEIKELNKWRYGIHGLVDSMLQRLSVLPKVIYRFSLIPNKNSECFMELDKVILKFI